jgi:hypothetical protein
MELANPGWELHSARFTIRGPDPLRFAALWLAGLSEAEFAMTRGFVADIEVIWSPDLTRGRDG